MSTAGVTTEGQADHVFAVGETLICRIPRGYSLTTGKEYAVVGYEPQCRDKHGSFAWPAYVKVIDDDGREAVCQTYRFSRLTRKGLTMTAPTYGDVRPESQAEPFPWTVVGTQRKDEDRTLYYVKNLHTNKCYAPGPTTPWLTDDVQIAHQWAKDCFRGLVTQRELHEVPNR